MATTVTNNERREKELNRRRVTMGLILVSAFITVSPFDCAAESRHRRADMWGPYGLVDSGQDPLNRVGHDAMTGEISFALAVHRRNSHARKPSPSRNCEVNPWRITDVASVY